MRHLSEAEVWAAAGETKPDLLAKVENDDTESAVALKRFPDYFVLGISCDLDGKFEMYAIEDEKDARDALDRHATLMERTGRPFFP